MAFVCAAGAGLAPVVAVVELDLGAGRRAAIVWQRVCDPAAAVGETQCAISKVRERALPCVTGNHSADVVIHGGSGVGCGFGDGDRAPTAATVAPPCAR